MDPDVITSPPARGGYWPVFSPVRRRRRTNTQPKPIVAIAKALRNSIFFSLMSTEFTSERGNGRAGAPEPESRAFRANGPGSASTLLRF